MESFDLIGACLSLICTYLFVNADKKAWLFSAIAIPFDAFVYYKSQLYGDMFLQSIYFASTFYGWYQWQYGSQAKGSLEVSYLSNKNRLQLLGIVICGIARINPLLRPFNQADVVWLDAITTVLSLAAQWLLCNKKIETWIIWFIVDSLYIYLYSIKALPFHSIMATVYLLMAIAGFISWYNSITLKEAYS
jgi:nicotinamide mononucleotide transporter